MTLRVAFQIDPIMALDIEGDSSFAFALEAQARGYEVFTYQPQTLSMLEGKVSACAQKTQLRDSVGDHATLEAPVRMPLSDFDVVLMRQDPPFDMQYITATYFLEHAASNAEVLVVNDPASVRTWPEKIMPLKFGHLMPPTLITSAIDEITAFRKIHGDIILKPLYGNGGKDVFLLEKNSVNYPVIAEMLLRVYGLPLIAQKFLENVRQGDKRIILIDGAPVAVLNRVPAKGTIRANLSAGAKGHLDALNPEDEKICNALGDYLRATGILFAGIDVIAGCLTEINITSPTGIRQIKALGGVDVAPIFWDAVLKKLQRQS